ncbi:MAG TPA: GspH/FimT family pseudopilin [Lacipirellulaceae bacterium]|nr:GspH/FimT family pseudopilin [Lacipirellulaceae bacterium]
MQLIQAQPGRTDLPRYPRTPRRGTDFHCRAFSMIEVVIVLLIMGVMAAVAVPTFFDSLLFHRVESAARRVKSDLELARTEARLTSATQSMQFTSSTYTLSNTTSLDKSGAGYTVDLTKEPFALDSATANFSGSSTISFDGYGTPSSAGTVTLTAKSHQCIVTLNGVTGDVTITSNHSGGRTAQVPGS